MRGEHQISSTLVCGDYTIIAGLFEMHNCIKIRTNQPLRKAVRSVCAPRNGPVTPRETRRNGMGTGRGREGMEKPPRCFRETTAVVSQKDRGVFSKRPWSSYKKTTVISQKDHGLFSFRWELRALPPPLRHSRRQGTSGNGYRWRSTTSVSKRAVRGNISTHFTASTS